MSGRAVHPGVLALLLMVLGAGIARPASTHSESLEKARGFLAASDLAAAEAVAREELARLERTGQATSLEAAEATDLLVEILVAAPAGSRYEESVEAARRSLAIKEALPGPGELRVAKAQADLADVISEKGITAEVIELHEKSVAAHEKALGPDDPEVGRRVLSLGIALKNKGETQKAKPSMERAVAIFEKAYGPVSTDLARALNGLANVQKRLGEYDEAIATAKRALEVQEKAAGREDEAVGAYASGLANLYRAQGQYSKAKPLYDRAVRIAEKEEGKESYGYANTVNSLGNYYMETGQLTEARPLYEEALAVFEKLYGPDSGNAGMATRNLGGVFLRMGDLDRALEYNERALSIFEKVNGSEHPSVSNALRGLAEVWLQKGEPSRGIPLLKRAQGIEEKARGTGHQNVGGILAAIGAAQVEAGQAQEALVTLQKALGVLETSVGPDHFNTAIAHRDMGQALYSLGRTVEARVQFERALAVSEKTYGPRHFELAATLIDLGRANWTLGSDAGAWACALRAESITREHFRLSESGLSEREALHFEAVRNKGIDLALSILASGKGNSAQVFDAVIRGRSTVLDALARRHRQSAQATDPITAALLEQLKDSKEQLARLAVDGPDQQHPETYLARLKDAQERKEGAERELALKTSSGTNGTGADLGLSDVVGMLPRHAVLVSYVRYLRTDRTAGSQGVPSYIAFVLRPGQPEPTAVPLGDAAGVETAVERWREAAGSRPAGLASATQDDAYRSAGEALRRLVWDPMAPKLGEADLTLIVPDGMLNLVSFATLPAADGRYMVELKPLLHYLSAERDVAKASTALSQSRDLLAMGGPDFGTAAASSTVARNQVHGTFRSVLPPCGRLREARFDPLPASRTEAKEVSALWSKPSTRVLTLTGPEATESAFKESASRYRILHLATHGFSALEDCASAQQKGEPGITRTHRILGQNPLLLSGLVLAGANRLTGLSPDEEDGYLTAEEIGALDLSKVEWAVLSACQTGLGKVISGEGILGLRRAFEVAGARTLIMSLWKVQDESTLSWMRALYKTRLSGASTAAAAREASVNLIEAQRSAGRTTHPFYWGGFVAAGDWR